MRRTFTWQPICFMRSISSKKSSLSCSFANAIEKQFQWLKSIDSNYFPLFISSACHSLRLTFKETLQKPRRKVGDRFRFTSPIERLHFWLLASQVILYKFDKNSCSLKICKPPNFPLCHIIVNKSETKEMNVKTVKKNVNKENMYT